MTRKRLVILLTIGALLTTGLVVQAAATSIKLEFVNHLQAKLPEQDVFIERVAGSGDVYRVTAADKNMNAPLYTAASPLPHDPDNPQAVGPYKKGRALGITLGQWLAGAGTGTYTCTSEQGSVVASFKKLVPNGTYTMWYALLATPPPIPMATYDLPLGARDGSQNVFRANTQGNASFKVAFKPCLQPTTDQFTARLAIAWHSDGKAYGGVPGPSDMPYSGFGVVSHVQLFLGLPKGK